MSSLMPISFPNICAKTFLRQPNVERGRLVQKGR
jgi:hypothetical protein